MRVLVTGGAGQLGHDVLKQLHRMQIEAIGADKDEFDLLDTFAAQEFILACKPDTVIHCAAYTQVDQAEDEPDICRNINIAGTEHVAQACLKAGSSLCYLSTDYVFDGTLSGRAYEVSDRPNPLSVYGQSKYEGEKITAGLIANHYIVRTSWLFGSHGHNFVKTMLKMGEFSPSLRVVADQTGSPTYTADLARFLADLIQTENFGCYHVTNSGFCSWADFAAEIFVQMGWPVAVERIPSVDYPTKATRPKNSRLSPQSIIQAGLPLLPDWKDGLSRFLKEINAV
ncbi:MAG: dTDP-4-dehydrorhamnose reductase [Syntrophobacterales bacterium]|jgi:dTDP-4-dehydrorhamnose reductase|nr:dTDP-4-dehydrorhamnose reductase [Syntrophobacterales bacterium]